MKNAMLHHAILKFQDNTYYRESGGVHSWVRRRKTACGNRCLTPESHDIKSWEYVNKSSLQLRVRTVCSIYLSKEGIDGKYIR